MKTYEFTAILSGEDVITEAIAESLYSVMDDANACSSSGVAMVQFDRAAEALEDAIRSGIADISRAGYKVSEIRMDSRALEGLINSK